MAKNHCINTYEKQFWVCHPIIFLIVLYDIVAIIVIYFTIGC